jgi:hypothetical protein
MKKRKSMQEQLKEASKKNIRIQKLSRHANDEVKFICSG